MNSACYRFMVGEIECIAVSDGTGVFTDPRRFLFENAPREELRQALLKYNIRLEEWKEWLSPFSLLAVRTGGRCVLVDTGNGTTARQPGAGRLLQSLQEAGIRPADVDTVILTHGHGDHVGGVTDASDRVVYENARHVMQRAEWEFWNSPAGREKGDTHLKLAALEGRLDLIEGETELASGVHLLLAAGHTPGNMVVSVRSGGEELLHLIDVVLHPLHMERPDWNLLLDNEYVPAAQTRRRLLEMAADGHILVMGYHFDFPGLGYVEKKGAAWEWQPLKASQ